MALLIDGLVADLEDIVQFDSGLAEVARAENISVDHKLILAQRDCELNITKFAINHGLDARLGYVNNMPRLDRVVVNAGLKRWFCLHVLSLFYSDAYYTVLNDRYGKKLEYFIRLANEAWEAFTDTGIACVYDPIPRGTILHVDLNEIPIGSGTYDVAIAWVSASGSSGSVGNTTTVTIGPGEGMTVVPGPPPAGVSGYNVYASVAGLPLLKQTSVPIDPAIGHSMSPIASGSSNQSEPSQYIDFVLRKSRMFTRG